MINTIGDRLKQAMSERQLSAPALADQAGIGRSLLHTYLNNTSKPGAESLYKLSKILNKTIDWIVTGEEPIIKKAEVIEDPDLEYMITWLRVMASDGPKRLNWARCQFDDAFGDYISKKNQTIQPTIAQRNRA